MNILQIQDQLKGLPDQALAGYVQNPDGQVPTYLALSELQRRKTMREKYQQQQAPQSTVADDMAQEAAPQPQMMAPEEVPVAEQGVASLPTGDMYQEQNFASGGIVAFDDGGEVAQSRFGQWWEGYKQRGQENLAKQDKIQRLQSEYLSLTTSPFQKITPSQEASNKARQAEIKREIAALQNSTPASEAPKAVPTPLDPTAQTGGPRITDTQLPSSFTGIDQQSQFNISPNALNQMNQPAAPADTPPVPGAAPITREGIGTLYKPLTDRSADYDELQREELGAAENAMAKYKQLIGDDTMRPKLEQKLTDLEERTKKQESQAPWMALARAGLGMAAGKSQYALQNIAEGATMGFEDYKKAQDRLETLRDKQFDIQSKLAQAQRAEDIAAATHGLKSEEAIKAQNHASKLAKLGYQTNLEANNQKNKIDAYEAITKKQAVDVSSKSADIQSKYYDILGKAALNKTSAGGLDEDTVRRSYDSYLKGEFMDLPPNMTYDQFKLHTQGLAGVGLSAKAQSAYDKYKPK